MRRLITTSLLLLSAVASLAGDPPAPRVVQQAETRREAIVAKARKMYLQAVLAAERQCVLELQAAAADAGKGGNTDLVVAIAEAKKAAEGRLEQARNELEGEPFTIYAIQGWQPTTEVTRGQQIEIIASGTWKYGMASNCVCGCDGIPETGWLECRIDSNDPFRIINKMTITVTASGTLQFQMHDANRADNSGSLNVVVLKK